MMNLKELFSLMIGSDRKYVDPTPVLTSIVDDYGNELPIGDQKDIGEFNLIFLSRVDEGLNEKKNSNKMDIEGEVKEDSPSKIKTFNEDDGSLLRRSSIRLS